MSINRQTDKENVVHTDNEMIFFLKKRKKEGNSVIRATWMDLEDIPSEISPA